MMNWISFFSDKTRNIAIVKRLENRIIFRVKKSNGLLREEYGYNGGKGLYSLVLDGIPLTKYHGDEYLCPTCQKLISAGYGIEKFQDTGGILSQISDRMNAPYESMEKSFEDVKPLLALLSAGYYMLSDEELFPTNGEDAFFWSITNTPTLNQATCPIYDHQGANWGGTEPKYLLPTQSPRLFNRERAEYYRNIGNTRAIAYHLEGTLCALLDGHHKATASALNGTYVKTLVISKAHGLTLPRPETGQKAALSFSGVTLYEDEFLDSLENVKGTVAGKSMRPETYTTYMSLIEASFDDYCWPNDILKSAKQYYDAYTYANIDWAGDLSDARLDAILSGDERADERIIGYIVHALFAIDSPRFIEFAIAVGSALRYRDTWEPTFRLLAKKRDKRIEDFFVDFLIADDGVRPWMTKIANDYFRA